MNLSFKRDLAIIVDAYSSGALIAPAFRAKGVNCVHVRSEANVIAPLASSFMAHDFIDDILFNGIEDLKQRLSAWNVRWVVPGDELGVELVAHLADCFDVEARNDARHAVRWRNKFVMHEALKAAGVRSISHKLTTNKEAMVEWAETVAGFPVVLKPKASAGTDNIHICETPEEVRYAFDCIMGAPDALLHYNEDVLGQAFLHNEEFGTGRRATSGVDVEYVVNTVSLDGQHFVNDIIKVYRRRMGNNPVHDYNELLCPVHNAQEYQVLGAYIKNVLDALGIRNGPGHSELMIVDGEPILLETAARLPGSTDMSAYSKALGFAQVELWMLSCTNPKAFQDYISRPRQPLAFHSSCTFLISDLEGPIKQQPDVSPWKALPSLHSISFKSTGYLTCTTDLTNTPGYVFLLSKDKSSLASERAILRAAERDIYRVMLQRTRTSRQ